MFYVLVYWFQSIQERSRDKGKSASFKPVIPDTMPNYNFYVYILTNTSNKVMYIGVTNDLRRRISEHKNGIVEGFTKRYNVHKLVYVEYYQDIRTATAREKQLKGWKRGKKNALVESKNPQWRELPV